VPDPRKEWTSDRTVQVLPLTREGHQPDGPGRCVYTYEHAQAPELEAVCGGINGKTPLAGAVFRQGNLLHFGFNLAPADMNETGQTLFINCVAYAARFTDDRPIVRTPCVFVGGKRLFDRDVIARLLKRQGDRKDLHYYLARD